VRVVSFPFSGFTAGGGTGADETSIAAIRLSIDGTGADQIDLSIQSAVLACGYDFGDAPEANGYTTTSDIKADTGGSGDGFIRNNTAEGPAHRIAGPFLGSGTNNTDDEGDGQPSANATGDDAAANSDEAAVSDFPDMGPTPIDCDGLINSGDSSLYCVAIEVSNPTDSDAQLAGWIDFSGGGVFSHDGCGSSTNGAVLNDFLFATTGTGWGCDRAAETIRLGTTGLSGSGSCGTASAADTPLQSANTIGDNDWTTGNIPANCSGTVVLVWDLTDAAPVTLGETFARFRITTDTGTDLDTGTGFFTTAGPAPFGFVEDGEVEDHVIPESTLPVSISGFETFETRRGIEVRWSTVSETENMGFHLWNFSGGTLEPLTADLIPSKTSDAADPQQYSYMIPRAEAKRIGQLAITAVDNRGSEEMYGLFELGQAYGRDDASTPIAWDSIRAQAEARLASLGFAESGGNWRETHRPRQPIAADFLVSEAGMQRITHNDLMAAGIDLRGRSFDQIAVTVDGEPVPRRIRNFGTTDSAFSRRWRGRDANRFSSRSVIEFWGERPEFPNARYVEDLIYRVELSAADVIAAGETPKAILLGTSQSYMLPMRDDRDLSYRMSTVLADPWSLAELRSWVAADSSHTSVFELPKQLIHGQPGHLEVLLAGLNDPSPAPDHHVQVQIGGQTVAKAFFNGRQVQRLEAEIPANVLARARDNISVEVKLPGGTEAFVDMVALESISLYVPASTRAVDDRLLVPQYEPGHYVLADGFVGTGRTAWAWNGDELLSVPTENAGRGTIRAVPPAEEGYELWISSSNALHRPEPVGAVGANSLLDEAGDFLVIAHPAFMPSSPRESHPLNDFVKTRESDGWNVRLVDITDIQAHYGGGMPLPQAVRRFLAAADSQFAYEHVLLVGSDSYDYHDILEMGSMSFIPTFYAATGRIAHTPSDGLLADLDGDGVSDKAIGRWPVRTLADLESIVYKTLDWSGSMEGLRNAVWVADLEEPGQPSFQAQANRLMDQLVDAGWTESQIDSVFLDDVASPDSGRDQLFGLLEQGRAFTGFVGHGAPSMWTFDGLLVPNDLAGLDNYGLPTMISTSTCYTSYFVSPFSETVAHRWMNGYDEDAQGNPIPGAQNGAVAIHGAATLSNYRQNEFVVSKVQGYQLEGMTLGQAVLQARRDAAERGLDDQVINWGLLGDPTLAVD
jgi:hypothetical protein